MPISNGTRLASYALPRRRRRRGGSSQTCSISDDDPVPALPVLHPRTARPTRFNVKYRTLAIWRVYCSAAITDTMGTFLIVLCWKIITTWNANPVPRRTLGAHPRTAKLRAARSNWRKSSPGSPKTSLITHRVVVHTADLVRTKRVSSRTVDRGELAMTLFGNLLSKNDHYFTVVG